MKSRDRKQEDRQQNQDKVQNGANPNKDSLETKKNVPEMGATQNPSKAERANSLIAAKQDPKMNVHQSPTGAENVNSTGGDGEKERSSLGAAKCHQGVEVKQTPSGAKELKSSNDEIPLKSKPVRRKPSN